MNIPDEKILLHYNGNIKSQGSSGRIYPNPLADHIGKKVIVIILDEECTEEPPRIAIQLQNRVKKLGASSE